MGRPPGCILLEDEFLLVFVESLLDLFVVVVPDRRTGPLIETGVSAEDRGQHSAAGTADNVHFPHDGEEVGALAPVGHDITQDVEGAPIFRFVSDFSQTFHTLVGNVDDGVGLVKPFEFEDVCLFGSSELEDRAGFDGLVEPPVEEVEEKSADRKSVV